jgi:anti-sigma factor RsiW
MTEKCFDEGIIQAFLDGELAFEMTQKVTRHIAACDVCAFMLAEAEEETAFAFSALEREFDTLVPTNRLWTKINDSIGDEKKHASVWQRFLSFVSVSLMSPSMAVAAGVLIFVGVFAVVFSVNRDSNTVDMAASSAAPPAANSDLRATASPKELKENEAASSPVSSTEIQIVSDKTGKTEVQKPKVLQAANRENQRRDNLKNPVVNANYVVRASQPNPANTAPKAVYADYLPGEESYVKTIANLSETVETQKDTVLRPAARISFERDLAVVDDAINKMKREVRKNPKNNSAKQVLYSSYQNKIDLLSSVADKTELMASLK